MLLSLGPLTTKNKCMKRPIPPLYAVAVAGVLCAPMILIAGFAVKTGDVLIVAPILFVLGTLVALLKLHDDVGPQLYTCFYLTWSKSF